MATSNLTDLPNKQTIKCGRGVISTAFRADDKLLTGYFGIENSTDGHLVPHVWISETMGGAPLDFLYGPKNKRRNAADVTGVGKLSFTTGKPSSVTQVRLARAGLYYINHELKSFGEGGGPTANSSLIRSVRIGGGV